FVLGVVEPMMSGIGGDGFYHVTLGAERGAGSAKGICYNGTGAAPEAATVAHYRSRGGIPLHGPLSTSIPGTVAGLALMHQARGRNNWWDFFPAATNHAGPGLAAPRAYPLSAGENRAALAQAPRTRRIFLDPATGEAPPLGSLIVQADLARTLEEIAADPDTL